MSIYSDHKVGALSDQEFRNEAGYFNRKERDYYESRYHCYDCLYLQDGKCEMNDEPRRENDDACCDLERWN